MFTTNRQSGLARLLWTMGVALGLLIPLRFSYASDMQVRKLGVGDGSLSALVSLYGKAAHDTKLTADVVQNPALALTLKASLPAVHLGIIVDNASLCRPMGLDAAVLKLIASVPAVLAKSSRLTVISYTGHALEVLAQAVPLSEARRVRFACDSKSVSGSPEKALGRFIVADEGDGLAKVAWLFTSGNLRLPPSALQSLKRSGVPLDVFLYNKPLGAALAVIAEEQTKELNDGQYHYQVVSVAEVPEPARYLSVQAPIPGSVEGGAVAIKFSAMKGEEALASSEQVVDLPKSAGLSVVAIVALSLAAVAVVALLISFLVWFFRRSVCEKCGLPYAPGKKQCAFPHRGEDAAFIGSWLTIDETSREKKKVVRMDRDVIEIGTHRRSRIPLIRPRGLRRACLARVRRISLGNGKVAYRLEPTLPRGYYSVDRNGMPVVASKNLAHGDILRFGDLEVSFVTQQEAL